MGAPLPRQSSPNRQKKSTPLQSALYYSAYVSALLEYSCIEFDVRTFTYNGTCMYIMLVH